MGNGHDTNQPITAAACGVTLVGGERQLLQISKIITEMLHDYRSKYSKHFNLINYIEHQPI